MKKIILVVLLFVFGFMFINEYTGMNTMAVGDSSEAGGKTIEITNIGMDFVKIKVGEEKGIIRTFDTKLVNGVEISVLNIFYVDEVSGRNADILIKAKEEKKEIEVKKINLNECFQASDCDDGDDLTTDLCIGTPKKCVNRIIIECETNLDCDDGKDNTKDSCKFSECFNEKIIGYKIEQPYSKVLKNETIEKELETIKRQGVLDKLLEKLFRWFN